MDWPFEDATNTACYTSRRILNGEDWVYHVTHDMDDGAWQFHPYGGTPKEEAAIVALEEILAIEPRLAELADLRLGWHAWRETKEGAWQRASDEEI